LLKRLTTTTAPWPICVRPTSARPHNQAVLRPAIASPTSERIPAVLP
jgi:hypothetical protein